MKMNPIRLAAIAVFLACAPLHAAAQTASEPEKKAATTSAPDTAKKVEKKAAAKTPEQIAAEKKAAEKRAAARKAAAKKAAEAKAAKPLVKAEPTQPGAQKITPTPGSTQVLGPGTYSTGPTVLRDKQGNVIPTNPEAYGVGPAASPKK